MGRLIVRDGPRTPPPEFVARLRGLDPTLTVAYNPIRHRWVIEQCVQHLAATPEHTHICRRIYVWMVQGEQDEYLSVDVNWDYIRTKLAERDVRQAGYEETPEGRARFLADADYALKKDEEKRESVIRQLPKLARKDNWLSMNRVKLLLERHSLRLNR